jgi:hypothetical protein
VGIKCRLGKRFGDFFRLGPLLSEADNDEEGDAAFEEMAEALHAIAPPVTGEEAAILVKCFGPDNCFGLAWTLLHLIESSPNSVVTAEPPADANPWVKVLWDRYLNSLDD